MQQTEPATRELLTPRETALFLSVDTGTLANWRSAGTVRLPFVRLGRAIRYRVRDLQRFLDAQTVGAAEEQGV